MTREEAIEILHYQTFVVDFQTGKALEMAISALRQEETVTERHELNEPLTLDELRKMDGEPVWVSVSNNWRYSGVSEGWCIVRFHSEDDTVRVYIYDTRHGARFFAQQDYGISWWAYRQKPEGGDGMRTKGYKCFNIKCGSCIGKTLCGEPEDTALGCVNRVAGKPMTNADCINAMTIEEKAEFLSGIAYGRETPWSLPFVEKFCNRCPKPEYTLDDGRKLKLHECDFKDGKCPHGSDIVWWLQQPAGEEEA